MSKVLVDTSVWIEWFNSKKFPQSEFLLRIVTCNPVIQEVLQGIRKNAPFDQIKSGLLSFPRLSPELQTDDYMSAAEIYRLGKSKGKTIRSSTDCLIAQVAISNKVPLYTIDKDFIAIASFTELELFSS